MHHRLVHELPGEEVNGVMGAQTNAASPDNPDEELAKLKGRVPTHDTPEWLSSRPKAVLDRPDAEQRERQLRELGYIE